jgi:hypothetical protein
MSMTAAPKLLTAAVALMSCAASGNMQVAPSPWFGLQLPGPPTEMVVDFSRRDLPTLAPLNVTGSADLTADRLMADLNQIVSYSYRSRDAGERLWGRNAGSIWTSMAVDYVAEQFRAAGLQNVLKAAVPFVREDHPLDWHVRLLGNDSYGTGSAPVELRSAMPMGVNGGINRAAGGVSAMPVAQPTEPRPATIAVTAPLSYIGDGSVAAIATADVKGRIAIVGIEPAPGAFYSNQAAAVAGLVARGAVGILFIYNLPGNMQAEIGSCPRSTPCFMLGGEDGAFLRAVVQHAAEAGRLAALGADLSVTREGRVEMNAPVVIGHVAGRHSAENIVVSAHSDSHFAGANDNASGVAALIALARHYARSPKPQHDMYFLLSAGHHHATRGMGSLLLLDASLPKKNIISLNLEHIGQAGAYRSYMDRETDKYGNVTARWVPTNWDSQGREVTLSPNSPAVRNAWIAAAKRLQFTAPARFAVPAIAEPALLVAAGAAAIQDVETSPWYHTSGDTPAAISPETLQRATLFYRDFIDRMDRLSRAAVWAQVP